MEANEKGGKSLRKRKVSAVNWTRNLTAKLIELYRFHSHLWDVSSENYKNRHLRNVSIEEMAKALGVDAHDVNDKIHNLRCQFQHISRKQSKNNNFKVKWEFFDALTFINGHTSDTMALYKIEGNVNEENDGEDSSNNSSNDVDISYSPLAETTSPVEDQGIIIASSQGTKRKKNPDKIQQTSPNGINGLEPKPADSFQIFGDFVADELRTMNCRAPDLQLQAKLEIQRIVLKMNELYDARTQCRFNV